MLLALDGDLVVGQCAAVLHKHPDKPTELYIDEVGTASTYLRQGIATAMMHEMFAWAANWDAEKPGSGPNSTIVPANALYRGFEPAEWTRRSSTICSSCRNRPILIISPAAVPLGAPDAPLAARLRRLRHYRLRFAGNPLGLCRPRPRLRPRSGPAPAAARAAPDSSTKGGLTMIMPVPWQCRRVGAPRRMMTSARRILGMPRSRSAEMKSCTARVSLSGYQSAKTPVANFL